MKRCPGCGQHKSYAGEPCNQCQREGAVLLEQAREDQAEADKREPELAPILPWAPERPA